MKIKPTVIWTAVAIGIIAIGIGTATALVAPAPSAEFVRAFAGSLAK